MGMNIVASNVSATIDTGTLGSLRVAVHRTKQP